MGILHVPCIICGCSFFNNEVIKNKSLFKKFFLMNNGDIVMRILRMLLLKHIDIIKKIKNLQMI